MNTIKFILVIAVALLVAKYVDFVPAWLIVFLVCSIWIAGFAWFASTKEKKRLEEIRASRPIASKEDFFSALEDAGYQRRDIELIYGCLEPYFSKIPFHPRPDDDLIRLYRLSTEDLEEGLEQMLKRENLAWPSEDEMLKLNERRVVNASYLLDFLALARANSIAEFRD